MMGCQVSGGSSLKVEETTVEMRKNPEGVAVSAPRFSWQLVTDKQDVMQTAYQIEVADSEKGLQAGSGLVWNSGRVESGQSVLVKYAGASLESGQKYWWRVTVWTNTGDKAQSSIQYWSMALLDSSDWKAGWIGLNDSTNLKLDGEQDRAFDVAEGTCGAQHRRGDGPQLIRGDRVEGRSPRACEGIRLHGNLRSQKQVSSVTTFR